VPVLSLAARFLARRIETLRARPWLSGIGESLRNGLALRLLALELAPEPFELPGLRRLGRMRTIAVDKLAQGETSCSSELFEVFEFGQSAILKLLGYHAR